VCQPLVLHLGCNRVLHLSQHPDATVRQTDPNPLPHGQHAAHARAHVLRSSAPLTMPCSDSLQETTEDLTYTWSPHRARASHAAAQAKQQVQMQGHGMASLRLRDSQLSLLTLGGRPAASF
jgi:hypothetical protein